MGGRVECGAALMERRREIMRLVPSSETGPAMPWSGSIESQEFNLDPVSQGGAAIAQYGLKRSRYGREGAMALVSGDGGSRTNQGQWAGSRTDFHSTFLPMILTWSRGTVEFHLLQQQQIDSCPACPGCIGMPFLCPIWHRQTFRKLTWVGGSIQHPRHPLKHTPCQCRAEPKLP